MPLWVEDALKILEKPPDDLNCTMLAIRCQEQVVYVDRMQFLNNIAGARNAYRDACQRAWDILIEAEEIKVPLLPVQPLPDDHPTVRDTWERTRQRRQGIIDKRNALLTKARKEIADAVGVAERCLSWRPEFPAQKPEQIHQPQGAGKK